MSPLNIDSEDLRTFLEEPWRRGADGNRMKCWNGRHVLVAPVRTEREPRWKYSVGGTKHVGPFDTPEAAARAAYEQLSLAPLPDPIMLNEPYEPPSGTAESVRRTKRSKWRHNPVLDSLFRV